jgi:uncharacterized protein (DUF1330 family)
MGVGATSGNHQGKNSPIKGGNGPRDPLTRNGGKHEVELQVDADGCRCFRTCAFAVQGLHAQMKPPVFVVGEVTVKDEAGYKSEWLPKIQPIIKESGGKYLAGGFNKTWTQMGDDPPNRVVVIQWPSMDDFKSYAEKTTPMFKGEGSKYGTYRIYAVEGVEQK